MINVAVWTVEPGCLHHASTYPPRRAPTTAPAPLPTLTYITYYSTANRSLLLFGTDISTVRCLPFCFLCVTHTSLLQTLHTTLYISVVNLSFGHCPRGDTPEEGCYWKVVAVPGVRTARQAVPAAWLAAHFEQTDQRRCGWCDNNW